jgi:hypothetical protein
VIWFGSQAADSNSKLLPAGAALQALRARLASELMTITNSGEKPRPVMDSVVLLPV